MDSVLVGLYMKDGMTDKLLTISRNEPALREAVSPRSARPPKMSTIIQYRKFKSMNIPLNPWDSSIPSY